MRIGTEDDYEVIAKLFHETIRTINIKDYTAEEVDAWANCSFNVDAWKKRLREQTFYLEEEGNVVVGFGSIAKHGYLDFMFVHKDYQGKGIAGRLLKQIEAKAKEQKNKEVYAFVSKTGEPFFLSQAYESCGQRHAYLNGLEFVNNLSSG